MSVTTAYAAVLAVFVGPSTPEDKLGIAEIGAVTVALVRGLHITVMLVAWLRSSPYRQGTADGILTMVANLKGQPTRRCAEGPPAQILVQESIGRSSPGGYDRGLLPRVDRGLLGKTSVQLNQVPPQLPSWEPSWASHFQSASYKIHFPHPSAPTSSDPSSQGSV